MANRHIGVRLENTPEYVFLIAGAALCGATVVGLNPTRRGAELAADIRGAEGGDLLHRPVGVHLPGQPDRVQPR